MSKPDDIPQDVLEAARQARRSVRACDCDNCSEHIALAILAERQSHEDHEMALYAKIQALAPHGTCGCSYDAPDDLCDHHSPKLLAAKAEQREADAKRVERNPDLSLRCGLRAQRAAKALAAAIRAGA
jgi:hypothetical protein